MPLLPGFWRALSDALGRKLGVGGGDLRRKVREWFYAKSRIMLESVKHFPYPALPYTGLTRAAHPHSLAV